nr:hypothetical protein [Haloterrigena salifodinae]
MPSTLDIGLVGQVSGFATPNLLTLVIVIAIAAGFAGALALATDLPVSRAGVAVAAAIGDDEQAETDRDVDDEQHDPQERRDLDERRPPAFGVHLPARRTPRVKTGRPLEHGHRCPRVQ